MIKYTFRSEIACGSREAQKLSILTYKQNELDNESIINQFNEHNRRVVNFISYIIIESYLNQCDIYTAHEHDQVNTILRATISMSNNAVLVPIKVFHIGRYQSVKLKPLLIMFNTILEVSVVVKNKIKNLSFGYPSISLSLDRT